MDLIFQNGYSLMLVIWGIVWTLAGAGVVALLVRFCDAEDRALTNAEKSASPARGTAISRVA